MKIYLIDEKTDRLVSTVNVDNLGSLCINGSGFVVTLVAPPSPEHTIFTAENGWVIPEENK